MGHLGENEAAAQSNRRKARAGEEKGNEGERWGRARAGRTQRG